MTKSQFEALRQLSGWHSDSRQTDALRLHFVSGLTQADAARTFGLDRGNLGRAVRAARATIDLARKLSDER